MLNTARATDIWGMKEYKAPNQDWFHKRPYSQKLDKSKVKNFIDDTIKITKDIPAPTKY